MNTFISIYPSEFTKQETAKLLASTMFQVEKRGGIINTRIFVDGMKQCDNYCVVVPIISYMFWYLQMLLEYVGIYFIYLTKYLVILLIIIQTLRPVSFC